MERLQFVSIYQTNLDEFFMVRVGTLMEQMNGKKTTKDNKTGLSSKEQINLILEEVERLELKRKEIYEQLMGELERVSTSLTFRSSPNRSKASLKPILIRQSDPIFPP